MNPQITLDHNDVDSLCQSAAKYALHHLNVISSGHDLTMCLADFLEDNDNTNIELLARCARKVILSTKAIKGMSAFYSLYFNYIFCSGKIDTNFIGKLPKEADNTLVILQCDAHENANIASRIHHHIKQEAFSRCKGNVRDQQNPSSFL